MKNTGVIRRVDELGRVVLPAEIRRAMGIGERELLEIYVEEDRLVMKKHRPACVFCGGDRELAVFRDRSVCSACREQLKAFRDKPI